MFPEILQQLASLYLSLADPTGYKLFILEEDVCTIS